MASLPSPRDRGAVGRESTGNFRKFDAKTVHEAVAASDMDGELVDMSKFPNLRAAARRAVASQFRFSSDYRLDDDFGYSCSMLWDKPNYRVVDDPVEFGHRIRALNAQLTEAHLDDIPRSKVEATLRATNGHVGRAMQQLHPMIPHPPPESVRKEMAALTGNAAALDRFVDYEQHVLPESVVQKIDDLPDEKNRNRMLSIRQKFKLIDTDGNGTLDIDEFHQLTGNLNMSREELEQDFSQLDNDGSGQVDFEEFLGWWKKKARKDQQFAELFDDIGRRQGAVKIKTPDVRATAATQNMQVQKFFNAGLRGRKVYWIEVVGTRLSVYRSQMDRDEKARLQLTDEEIVGVEAIPRDKETKTGFEIEVVLGGKTYGIEVRFDGEPTAKLEQLKQLESWVGLVNLAINHKHDNRSGEELWRVARTRAPLIKDVVRFLGDSWMGYKRITNPHEKAAQQKMSPEELAKKQQELQEMEAERDNIYSEPIIPRGIRNPHSKFSMVWDLLQVIFLLSVCYFVPIRTCFSVEVELWSAEFWWDVVVDVYFIMDLVINFRTAIFDGKGVIVTNSWEIAKSYLSGWFLIDFLSCLPVGYIGYISTDTMAGGGLDPGVLKSLRLLRMGKMMRLAKLYRMLKKYENFAALKPVIGLATMIGIILLAAHMLACFWFLIGSTDQVTTELDPATGNPVLCTEEMAAAEGDDACTLGAQVQHTVKGWVAVYEDEYEWWGPAGLKAELGTRYATSMYLIFNGLENGYTDTEKYFAIFSELIVSSLIYGGMAALMTESLVEANDKEKEFNARFSALKTWMTERHLQKSYINKVLNYYSNKYKDSVIFDQGELLKELPPAMATSLMKELYGDIVAKMPFFNGLDEVITTKLAALAKPIKVHMGQPIIEEGKTGLEMYILIEGECLVEKGGIELGILNASGSYFGELPIVNARDHMSETRQRTVKAMTDCDLIYLDQEDVNEVAERHPELKERLVRFAKLGMAKGKKRSQVAEDWAQEHSYGIQGHRGQDQMTSFINTITSKKWGNGGSPGATPLTSPANGTEPAPGAALRGPMGGNSTANGTGGQHAANGSGGGGASVEQLAELFGKLEAKMLERVETRMSTVSTEVSEIHSFLAQQQQLQQQQQQQQEEEEGFSSPVAGGAGADGSSRESLMPHGQRRP